MGEQNLNNGDVNIGKLEETGDGDNKKVSRPLKDTYTYKNIGSGDTINGVAVTSNNIKEGDVLDNGTKVVTAPDETHQNGYYVSTNKTPLNMYISGRVISNDINDVNDGSLGAIVFNLPDDSIANFTSLYVEGGFRLTAGDYISGTDVSNKYGKMKEVNFLGTTFNGHWLQNSFLYAKTITFDGVTFLNHINSKNKNNSNPIWIQNCGNNYGALDASTDIVIKNSTINASRPLKFFDGTFMGANYTFTNNTFNMVNKYIAKDDDTYKDCGIYLGGSIKDGSNAKITIKDNTLNSGTALIAFAKANTVNSNVTFDVSGNKDSDGQGLNNEKLSVTWKGTTYHAIPTTSNDD